MYEHTKKKKSLFGLKKSTTTTTRKEDILRSSNLTAVEEDISLLAQNNVTIVASNVQAKDNINIDAGGDVSIRADLNVFENTTSIKKNTLGGLLASKITTETVNTEVVGSELSSDNINITAGNGNGNVVVEGSTLKADSVDIDGNLVLVSSKEREQESKMSDKSGVLTRTIITQGYFKEHAVAAQIDAQNLTINGQQVISQGLSPEGLATKITSENPDLTRAQIQTIQAQLNSDEWYDKTTTISQMGALIVKAVVSYFTAGMGAGLVDAGIDGIVQNVIDLAVQNTIEQAASQFLTGAITGDMNLDLDLGNILESAVQGAVIGELNTQISDNLINPIDPENLSFAEEAQKTILESSAQSLVYGTSFEDNLKNSTLNTGAERAFEFIGHELYENDKYEDLALPPKTVTHALVGGVFAELKGGDFSSGAIATAAGHVVADYTRDHLFEDALNGDMTDEQLKTKVKAVASAVGGAAAIISNENISQQELNAATAASESVVENNSVKLVTTALKIARKIKNLKNVTKDDIKKIIQDEGLDILDDANTIVDALKGNAEPLDIALAIADLALGTDLNNAKTRAIGKINKNNVAKRAKISTGRTEPKNLNEQLAMEEVMANPSGVTPPRIPKMSDTKNNLLHEEGWVKRTQNVNGVEIHYVENINSKEVIDFKFAN